MKLFILLLLCLIPLATANDRDSTIEQQIVDLMAAVRGKTVAMLTNPTSVDARMQPLFERILQMAPENNVTLRCFFAPEHGLRGDRQDGKGD